MNQHPHTDPRTASGSVPPADPLTVMAASLEPKRAVSYIRVSTRGQAERGGAEEGFSIPAQREANKRKAASLGALIVKEFVDRGESARSANRPELQKMLRYLRETPGIDFCIVHKLDRLARNRADDVEINKAFDEAGVRLISTSENIDQTPGGMLLHGIMSSIAEFYSRNLANEAIKGMRQKAQNGGTISKAPLGYRNIRTRDEQGREVRTVELDPERAPLMRLAFSEYATGRWTVRQLAEHLSGLGLDVPAKETHGKKIYNSYGRDVIIPTLPFPRIPLRDAKEMLVKKGVNSEKPDDLSPEEERALSEIIKEKYGHEFVFVTEYPVSARPFYHMRLEEDQTLTKSFDLLWNGIEITTGAQREHRYEQLMKQAKEKGLRKEPLEFYFNFFKYGCPPHGGIGLSPSRLLMKLLNVSNVREVTYLYRGPKRLTP